MPEPRNIHQFVSSYETFSELLEEADSEQSSHELLAAVEGLGQEVQEISGADPDTLGPRVCGWLWLLWEDIHDEDPEAPEMIV
ncbi:hypothetical protein GCM10028857_13300 [Salinarchaeum chitinilyticum]